VSDAATSSRRLGFVAAVTARDPPARDVRLSVLCHVRWMMRLHQPLDASELPSELTARLAALERLRSVSRTTIPSRRRGGHIHDNQLWAPISSSNSMN